MVSGADFRLSPQGFSSRCIARKYSPRSDLDFFVLLVMNIVWGIPLKERATDARLVPKVLNEAKEKNDKDGDYRNAPKRGVV